MKQTTPFEVTFKKEDSKPKKEKVIFIDKKGNVKFASWDKIKLIFEK